MININDLVSGYIQAMLFVESVFIDDDLENGYMSDVVDIRETDLNIESKTIIESFCQAFIDLCLADDDLLTKVYDDGVMPCLPSEYSKRLGNYLYCTQVGDQIGFWDGEFGKYSDQLQATVEKITQGLGEICIVYDLELYNSCFSLLNTSGCFKGAD